MIVTHAMRFRLMRRKDKVLLTGRYDESMLRCHSGACINSQDMRQ